MVIGHTLMGIRMYRDLAIHGKKQYMDPERRAPTDSTAVSDNYRLLCSAYRNGSGGVDSWEFVCGLACVAAAVIIPELAMRNENSLTLTQILVIIDVILRPSAGPLIR